MEKWNWNSAGPIREAFVEFPRGEIFAGVCLLIVESWDEDEWEEEDGSVLIRKYKIFSPALELQTHIANVRVRLWGRLPDEVAFPNLPLGTPVEEGELDTEETFFSRALDRDYAYTMTQRQRLQPETATSLEKAETVLRKWLKQLPRLLHLDASLVQQVLGGATFSVTEVSEQLRVPRNTILSWINGGKLKAFRSGKKWMVTKADLEAARNLTWKEQGE